MKLTLSQIEAFFWIARLGSFRAAAKQLSLTQPTVSLRIRAIEQALGLRLFERVGRQMRLTRQATALLPMALRMMDFADQIAAHARSDPLCGRLRLGAPASFALSCMAGVLSALKDPYPNLTIALTINNSVVLCNQLNERQLDMAFVVEPEVAPYVCTVLLGGMQHAWVASADLGLAGRSMAPRDLVGFRIFTQPEPSNLATLVKAWFARAGLEPQHISTCNDLSVIIRLTEAGEGISLLPPAILVKELRTGTLALMPTRSRLQRSRLFAAYQADTMGPTARTVLEIARAIIAQSNLLEQRRSRVAET